MGEQNLLGVAVEHTTTRVPKARPGQLDHQVRQLERGAQPDNYVDPKEMDALTGRYLRDAFREVASIQRSLASELTWSV